MMAAIGKQLKQSVKVFHNLMLYRLLPTKWQFEHVFTIKFSEKFEFVTPPLPFLNYFLTEEEIDFPLELLQMWWWLTFVIKTVDSVDAGTFMVAPEEEKIFWVFDFVGQE